MMKKKNNFENGIIKEHYIKPKECRHNVYGISRKLTNSAMKSKKPRYIKTLNFKNENSYFEESQKVLAIAEAIEPCFKLSISIEEAHEITEAVNKYLTIEAKRNNKMVQEIDYEVVINSFLKMKMVYRKLMLYFRGFENDPNDPENKNGLYDLDKGIYIYGGVGSGKTLAMQVFKEYTKTVLQQNSFQMVTASDILKKVYKGGLNTLDQFVRSRETYNPLNMYIEDFGAGNKRIKHMGNDVEPMGELILERYRSFERYGTLTHLCTNIKPSDFPNHFDERVCSRFNKMFNIINLNLFDWRKI